MQITNLDILKINHLTKAQYDKLKADGTLDECQIYLTDSSSESNSGIIKSDSAPSDINALWIDTANGGIAKYYNGTSWEVVKSVWG